MNIKESDEKFEKWWESISETFLYHRRNDLRTKETARLGWDARGNICTKDFIDQLRLAAKIKSDNPEVVMTIVLGMLYKKSNKKP